tara:strand:+ start:1118 stop:2023 length:906 start_codon:yes stop_codon:yes gene_type:complete
MRALVTGGAGFIGSNLVDKLIEDNHEVIIVDNMSTGKKDNINPKAEFWGYDIADVDENWDEVFKGVDIVFHTAAKARVQPSIDNPVEFDRTNVGGIVNMLDCSKKYGVTRFIYSSSSSVYGNVEQTPTPESHKLSPLSPYALQKLIGEQYCKLFSELYGLETVCLRYFNVYGERQLLEGAYCLVMGIFARQKLSGEPMTIRGDGEQRRDFTYVGDVVDANIRCATNLGVEFNGEVFNIGNGDNRSVNQIADMIGGDKVNVEPVIEPRETLADNSKAKRVLGWETTVKIEDWMKNYKEDMGL